MIIIRPKKNNSISKPPIPKKIKRTLATRDALNILEKHLRTWYSKSLEEEQPIFYPDVKQEIQAFLNSKPKGLNIYEALDTCIALKEEGRKKIFLQLKRRLQINISAYVKVKT